MYRRNNIYKTVTTVFVFTSRFSNYTNNVFNPFVRGNVLKTSQELLSYMHFHAIRQIPICHEGFRTQFTRIHGFSLRCASPYMAYRIAFYCKGFLQTYFARIRSLTTVSSHMVCQMASLCKRISNMHRANTVYALCLVITMLMPRQMSTFSQRFREHNAGIRIFLRCAP